MAFAHSAVTAHAFTSDEPREGFFRQLFRALMLARHREAEREIARYFVHSGGKFTDEAEREIERRFLDKL
jgi:hypothetical protein